MSKIVTMGGIKAGDNAEAEFPTHKNTRYRGAKHVWGCVIIEVDAGLGWVKVKRNFPRAKPQWLPLSHVVKYWRFE